MDEEGGGSLCPVQGGQEEVPISIQIHTEVIYEFLFAALCMFQRVCLPRGKLDYIIPIKQNKKVGC